jgi:hypothetical protein
MACRAMQLAGHQALNGCYREAVDRMELLPAVVRIEDYRLEELLRSPEQFAKKQSKRKREADVNWRQMTQFAASHAVNDFYALPFEARTAEAIAASVEHWWTNRNYKFISDEHYLQTKQTVIEHLQLFLLNGACPDIPIICFEQLTTYVDDLDMELSQIFHTVIEAGNDGEGFGSYTVQKFVVDADREALELLFHMTSVFGESAFGRLPARIEALSLLDGKRITFEPDDASLEYSYDYMYLVKTLLPETDVFKVNPLRDLSLIT